MQKSSSPKAFESVKWDDRGEPKSLRFDDIYRSSGTDHPGGLAQARHVFLSGCALLGDNPLWQNASSWSILETGFGLGLNFLATWAHWRTDPARPKRLNFVSIEAHPVGPQDLIKGAAHWPELQDLAHQLSAQYWGLGQGFQTLSFDSEAVSLTLCIGDVQDILPEIVGQFDSIFLDGFSPERNPRMWETLTLKGIASHAKPQTKLATWCVKGEVRQHLKEVGFEVQKLEGLPPKRECLSASYDPPWRSKVESSTPHTRIVQEALIVGKGLSGASLARSLASRGVKVRVTDELHAIEHGATQHIKPLRAGASGLPIALFHPMDSRDDNLQSKMTRMGIRMLLSRIEHLAPHLKANAFKRLEVLEVKKKTKGKPAPLHNDETQVFAQTEESLGSMDWSAKSTMLSKTLPEILHHVGGWIQPQAYIECLLSHPNIEVIDGFEVQSIESNSGKGTNLKDTSRQWQLVSPQGARLETSTLILCTGFHTRELLASCIPSGLNASHWPIQAIKGQLTLGRMSELIALMPHGVAERSELLMGCRAHVDQASFLAQLPSAIEDSQNSSRFCIGSTFERDQTQIENSAGSERKNLLDLARVLEGEIDLQTNPESLKASLTLEAWSGVRCTTPDRMPIVGEIQEGLWVNFGLGSRGLSLCTLMAETLSGLIEREPLALPKRLLKSIQWERFASNPGESRP